jgi:hypothetical protein
VGLRIDGSSGGDRAREKRRLLLYAWGLVSVVLLWTFLIFFLGVGSGAGGSEAAGARGDENSGAGRAGEQAGDGDRESTDLEADHGGKDYVTPEDPEAFVEREHEEDRLAQHEPAVPPGGATDEPAGHDPLGIQNQDVPLTPADEGRAEGAAAKFVEAAYGYSGRDRDEYLDSLNALLVPQKFYASPGSEEIERLSEQVETTGTRGAARMSAFEIEKVEGERVEGYAYFETADSYDRYGELVGDKKGYRQRLTLVRSGAIFLVETAGGVDEVRGR